MGDPISMTLAGVSMGSKLLSIPTTMAATGTAQQAARIGAQGAMIGAEGAKFAAQAEANAWTYKAGIAKTNADFAEKNAEIATLIGEETAQQKGLEYKFKIAETRAQQGASGIRTGAGTGQKVIESMQQLGDYEQSALRNDAARQAYGLRIQGFNYQAESEMDRVASDNAIKAGQFKVAAYDTQAAGYKVQEQAAGVQGVSSLLGSVGSLSTSALDFYRQGVFGSGGAMKQA
jgi:hypothetical protein